MHPDFLLSSEINVSDRNYKKKKKTVPGIRGITILPTLKNLGRIGGIYIAE